jgi:hypothetical protein
MNKTITSLAILKVNWDERRKDYVENFVPFAATLISKKRYETIDTHKMCEDFSKEYGLLIPYHAMITVLTRVNKRGYIQKSKGRFLPVMHRLSEVDFSSSAKDQTAKYENVIERFVDFSKEKYKQELTREEAESAFIYFLEEHDLDILFLNQERTTVLPKVTSTKKQKFLLNSFIKHTYETDRDVFQFIVNIALGHILASALLYREFDKFRGKLGRINLYFDTGFIMRLLATEGEERKLANVECLSILAQEGAKLFVFRHTYEEIMGILDTCLKWIENPKADPAKAGPALRYFLENNYKASDVERLIINVDAILAENRIQIADTPEPDKYRTYQIDENKLRDMIITTYRESVPSFIGSEKDFTIQKDINSISAVYRLRRGRTARTIKDAGEIFVTTNFSLAWANRRFEVTEAADRFTMPACLTDVFVGTLVWLEAPAKLCPINEKKIIADCYVALQPEKELLGKYLIEVEKLRSQGKIREQEYYFLRTHRTAMNLLEEKTMGDPGRFTDQTAEEILKEVTEEIRKEGEKKYLEEKEGHQQTKGELTTVKGNLVLVKGTIENRAEQISSFGGRFCFVLLLVLFVAGLLSQFFPGFLSNRTGLRVCLLVITGLLGIMSVATGFNIRGLRNTLKVWIRAKVIEYLTPKTPSGVHKTIDDRNSNTKHSPQN